MSFELKKYLTFLFKKHSKYPSDIDLRAFHDNEGNFLMNKYMAHGDLKNNHFDKFQIITARLIDTLHGYLSGDSVLTSYDQARAVCTLISDMTRHLKKEKLIPEDIALNFCATVSFNEKDPFKEYKQVSNFTKHADKDADKTRFIIGEDFHIHSLLETMVHDYEALHCAMLKNDLLTTDYEKLIRVKRNDLLSYARQYNDFFVEARSPFKVRAPDGNTKDGRAYWRLSPNEKEEIENEYAFVPISAAVVLLYNKTFFYSSLEIPLRTSRKIAKKMERKGYWPFNKWDHALFRRDKTVAIPIDTGPKKDVRTILAELPPEDVPRAKALFDKERRKLHEGFSNLYQTLKDALAAEGKLTPQIVAELDEEEQEHHASIDLNYDTGDTPPQRNKVHLHLVHGTETNDHAPN